MNSVIMVLSICLNGLLSFIIYKSKTISNDLSVKNGQLQEQIKYFEEKLEKLQNDSEEFNKLKINYGVLKEKYENLEKTLYKKQDYDEIKQKNIILQEQIKQSQEYYSKLKEEMVINFQNISNEILKQQKTTFTEEQNLLLQPFKNQITEFKTKMEDINRINVENRIRLEEQIKNLDLNGKNIAKEAQNLTTALQGNKKMQGNWGEIQLERLLEINGLKEGIDYNKQETTISENGDIHRPDFIINLPEDKRVVIDSKVSLNNYERYINAVDGKEKEIYIKNYINDLKNHIKELGDKEYYKEFKKYNSLDYVFMFIPLERAYIDAIDNSSNDKTDIYRYAYNNNVAIATPSSLMPVLKIIKYLWNIEKQNSNTEKIVKLATDVYDKLCNFQEDMKFIDKNITSLRKSYNSAVNKLYDGRGNMTITIEKLKEYGVSSKKQLKLEKPSLLEEYDIINDVVNNDNIQS